MLSCFCPLPSLPLPGGFGFTGVTPSLTLIMHHYSGEDQYASSQYCTSTRFNPHSLPLTPPGSLPSINSLRTSPFRTRSTVHAGTSVIKRTHHPKYDITLRHLPALTHSITADGDIAVSNYQAVNVPRLPQGLAQGNESRYQHVLSNISMFGFYFHVLSLMDSYGHAYRAHNENKSSPF